MPKTDESIPVTVTAPIVTDARTQEGVKPLLDFVASLRAHSNTEFAEAEAERLDPYFEAMSLYLTKALDARVRQTRTRYNERDNEREGSLSGIINAMVRRHYEGEGRAMPPKDLLTKGSLSGIFNAMARRQHNTLLSDVAVLPSNITKDGPAASLFRNNFDVDYNYLGHSFNFGFLQVFEGGDRDTAKSTTTFPIFTVDDKMIDAAGASAGDLLAGIKEAMTFVNHDMLHHFTTPVINSTVAYKFGDRFQETPVNEWYSNETAEYYEDWAHIGQEKIWLQPENALVISTLHDSIERYFDALEKMTPIESRNFKGTDEEWRHAVVDYFGMVMTHVMTRVFPLHHPIISRCLERLQKADPLHGESLKECATLMHTSSYGTEAEVLYRLRRHIKLFGTEIGRILRAYREEGIELLPEEDEKVGYKNIKILQLAGLIRSDSNDDLRPHIPSTEVGPVARVRKDIDKSMLTMIEAAAKTTGYKPKGGV